MRNIGFPERKRKKHKQVSESLLQRFFISGIPNEFLPYIIEEETAKNFIQNIRYTKDLHYLCQCEIYFIEAET